MVTLNIINYKSYFQLTVKELFEKRWTLSVTNKGQNKKNILFTTRRIEAIAIYSFVSFNIDAYLEKQNDLNFPSFSATMTFPWADLAGCFAARVMLLDSTANWLKNVNSILYCM